MAEIALAFWNRLLSNASTLKRSDVNGDLLDELLAEAVLAEFVIVVWPDEEK